MTVHTRIVAGFLILLVPSAHWAAQDDVRDLNSGAPLARELAAGETHSFRITLGSGQYLHLVVDQRGIDVTVRLVGPDGAPLGKSDSRSQGPESVMFVTQAPGAYRIEVSAKKKDALPGRYEVRIERLQAATAQDENRIATREMAAKAVEDGARLSEEGSADSRQRAIEKYQEACWHWQAAHDRQEEAYTLLSIGWVYRDLRQWPHAIEYYEQALTLFRFTGDQSGEGAALHSIGLARLATGEFQKAVDALQEALPPLRATAFRDGEAATVGVLGGAYLASGEMQPALNHLQQSLSLWQLLGDRYPLVQTLRVLGSVYAFLDRQKEASGYFDQAKRLETAGADFKEELSPHEKTRLAAEIAQGEGYRLVAQATLESRREAIAKFNEALQGWRSLGDQYMEALALTMIGSIYYLLGENQKAVDCLSEALSLWRTLGNRYQETIMHGSLGEAYYALSQRQKAFEHVSECLDRLRVTPDPYIEANALYLLARIERDRGRLVEARTRIDAVLDFYESYRTKVASQDLRASFLSKVQEAYHLSIDLLMRLDEREPAAGHNRAALQASERARARSLLELLTEAKIDVRQGIDPELKKRERELDAQLSSLQSRLIAAHSQAKPNPEKIASADQALKKAEREREQLEMEIRQKHPRYAELRYPTPLDVKAIQALLDEQTALVEYALGANGSFLFAVTKERFLAARLPAGPLISERVETLRRALTEPKQTTLPNYLDPARWLYQQLIQPAAKLLAGKQQLIIVPDGILYYLPFEALLTSGARATLQPRPPGQWPYLVRQYAVSYVPSAGILASLQDQRPARAKPNKTFLSYADPFYGGTDLATIRGFANGRPWELKPLPYSRAEVERIAKLYRKEEVAKFMGAEASEENVKAEDRLSQYRYVHFSVHGLLNESEPQYAGLVLSLSRATDSRPKTQDSRPTEQNPQSAIRNPQSEDGLLQVYEIFNLRLNADLVVLSACETGLGKQVKGEGVIGLTRAFLYAGTPSVVVSLWKVLDRSTPELMSRFYRHLKDEQTSKAHALRQAQLELLRQKGLAHPYYWASFVVVGRP
jgi:CHAT domain-containing protein